MSAVRVFSIPKTPKQLRQFLEMTGWYRRLIPNFASINSLLTDCLKKGKTYNFTEDVVSFFKKLQNILITAPYRQIPILTYHFTFNAMPHLLVVSVLVLVVCSSRLTVLSSSF